MVDIGNGGVDGAVVMGDGGVSEGKVSKGSFSLVLFFIPSCNVFPIC